MLTFVYALSVTPFEYKMLGDEANNFDTIQRQDYPIHLLYCANNKNIVYCGDSVKGATVDKISGFMNDLRKCGIHYKLKYRILCSKEQNEENLLKQINEK